MLVGMGAQRMPVGDQSLDQRAGGAAAVEIAGEEEMRLDPMSLQGLANHLSPIVIIAAGEHQVDHLAGGVPAHDRSEVALITIRLPLTAPAVQGGQVVSQAGGAVHRRLVGGIIAVIVVIDAEIGLELGILITVDDADADQALEDGSVDRPIHQPAVDLEIEHRSEGGMGIDRRIALRRQSHDHAGAPGIAAEEPVAQRRLHLVKALIAAQPAVELRLGEGGGHQVVGAPDEGHPHQKTVGLRPAVDLFQSHPHKTDKLPRGQAVGIPGHLVMTEIDEGIPLVMAGGVGDHPGGHRLEIAPVGCLLEQGSVFFPAEQRRCGQFHVIDIIVFFIKIRRDIAGGLAYPQIAFGVGVGLARFAGDLLAESRIIRSKQLAAQSEGRGKLGGSGRYPGGAVLVFGQSLRFACDVIHRALPPLAVAVIDAVPGGQGELAVIAVVGDLVEHHPRFRIQLIQPVEPPTGFVEDVGYTVGPGIAIGLVGVAKGVGIFLVGKKHLIDSIGGSGGILQVVGRIMPAAGDVDQGRIPLREIHDEAVAGMAGIAQEGIIAAALLAHIIEQEIRRPVIHICGDGKLRRADIAHS